MHESLLHGLRAQRPEIHARWEALLRTERVNTPLANPDALVHLIEWTLDQIFAEVRPAAAWRRLGPVARSECPCGRNPLLAFFLAGEQALLEALVLRQAADGQLDPAERDTELAELQHSIREIARREVEAFCAVCLHRHEALAHQPAHMHAAEKN